MGSPMGGLISHFALLEHPEVFGAAGGFPPSFWVSPQPFEATRAIRWLLAASEYAR